jgi:hypothetical protein
MASPFLKLVADPEVTTSDAGAPKAQLDTKVTADDSPVAAGEYPLSLSGITGYARRELVRQFPGSTESSAPTNPAHAGELARALARLAEAGVAGANPDDWYGLAGPSTERDIVDEADRAEGLMVHVSPSRL